MPDGPYLELLSFTHPESHYPPSTPSHDARLHQPWANKLCGWVAFAFLGTPRITPTLSTVLNERLRSAGSSTRYTPEVSGGRTRLDGVELRWEITAPERWGEKEGGTRLPFFCGDVTPRELRVRVPVHLPQSELFFFFLFFFLTFNVYKTLSTLPSFCDDRRRLDRLQTQTIRTARGASRISACSPRPAYSQESLPN